MCKLLILTNTQKVKSMKALVSTAAKLCAESERDGFGYFVQTSSGVYGEKTLRPASFAYSMHRPDKNIPFSSRAYERIGKRAKGVGAAVFHGRTSTNEVSLRNTHPIAKHGWTLCHNGVVSDHGPAYTRNTTNDTEHIVERLATGGIESVEKYLTGYYAFGALDPHGILHVVKDSTANLFVSWSEELDSYVFATKEDHITRLCDSLAVSCSVPAAVNNNTHLTFRRGELQSHTSIEPRGYTRNEASWSSASLGRALDVPAAKSQPAKQAKQAKPPIVTERWFPTKQDQYTVDEQLFLLEIEQKADSSYSFKDYKGNLLSYRDFINLEPEEQLCCTVVRPDGTICDQVNYYSEELFGS